MIYFLFGPNSYQALRKIREFKAAFLKKRGNLPLEEFDGESSEINASDLYSALGQESLFSRARLVIFKNISGADGGMLKILQENGKFLKESGNIFVFWEREPEKQALAFFKKYAEKIQEMKILEKAGLEAWLARRAKELGVKLGREGKITMVSGAGREAEWALENELEKMSLSEPPKAQVLQDLAQRDGASRAIRQQVDMRVLAKLGAKASPFLFVEKLVSAPLSRALLALKEAEASGQDLQRLIYPLLWKIKQKKMADAYFKGIQAESAMRRDPKNSYEILERLIFSMNK
ncbi:MAG: hypothetical protein HYW15_00395 [Candidatus Giovannonibacteria bacterium]|nr:MAG: hypothetical protein HYW15_00395 [Candidatus Giovannonibacteria bacterium]